MLIAEGCWCWSVWQWHCYLNTYPNSSEIAITKNTAGDCILISPRVIKVYLHAYTEVIYLYKHMFIVQSKLVTGQSKHAYAGLFHKCFRRALAPRHARAQPQGTAAGHSLGTDPARPWGTSRKQPQQRRDFGEVELLYYQLHTVNLFSGTWGSAARIPARL